MTCMCCPAPLRTGSPQAGACLVDLLVRRAMVSDSDHARPRREQRELCRRPSTDRCPGRHDAHKSARVEPTAVARNRVAAGSVALVPCFACDHNSVGPTDQPLPSHLSPQAHKPPPPRAPAARRRCRHLKRARLRPAAPAPLLVLVAWRAARRSRPRASARVRSRRRHSRHHRRLLCRRR